MKIVVTGSLGNISKPLTQELVEKGHEVTGISISGEAIGKPDLKWIIISSEAMLADLIGMGMNPEIAAGLVEMYKSQQSGKLWEDYYQHNPENRGKVKMTDFAKDFAAAYQQD